MTFNRQLFKEAYKAGYKKARLNEALDPVTGKPEFERGTTRGNNMGVRFIDTLSYVYSNTNCKIVVHEYDRKDRYNGEYEGRLFNDGLSVEDGRRTLMVIREKNIEHIEVDAESVNLRLDNGYTVRLTVYKKVDFSKDPFWQERFAIGRRKN